MKKTLLVLGTVVVLAGVGIPYGAGLVFKPSIQAAIDEFNAADPTIQLTITDYQRNWFSSDVTLTLSEIKRSKYDDVADQEKDDASLKPLPKTEWDNLVSIKAHISH